MILSWFIGNQAPGAASARSLGRSKKKSEKIKPADGILAAVQNKIGEGASARPVRQLEIDYTARRMSAMRPGYRLNVDADALGH
jgi:hypothetical protein